MFIQFEGAFQHFENSEKHPENMYAPAHTIASPTDDERIGAIRSKSPSIRAVERRDQGAIQIVNRSEVLESRGLRGTRIRRMNCAGSESGVLSGCPCETFARWSCLERH